MERSFDFPAASYDRWKTTPPDYWYGHEETLTPEQEAEEAFDEWYGDWLTDLADDGYMDALTVEGRAIAACDEVKP